MSKILTNDLVRGPPPLEERRHGGLPKLVRRELMRLAAGGKRHYLWRTVDHEGEVLESYVTKKRDKTAALRFLKKALKRHGKAENIVTDGLKSYPAAMRDLGNVDRRIMGQ